MNDTDGSAAGFQFPSDAEILSQLEERYASRGQEAAWQIEAPHWQSILRSLAVQNGGIAFNYCIERVLDVGGAGAVFRVVDLNLFTEAGRPSPSPLDARLRRSFRALKVPRPHLEKGPTLADSLREEISRLTSLTHPNVVSLFAKGTGPTITPFWGDNLALVRNAVCP